MFQRFYKGPPRIFGSSADPKSSQDEPLTIRTDVVQRGLDDRVSASGFWGSKRVFGLFLRGCLKSSGFPAKNAGSPVFRWGLVGDIFFAISLGGSSKRVFLRALPLRGHEAELRSLKPLELRV